MVAEVYFGIKTTFPWGPLISAGTSVVRQFTKKSSFFRLVIDTLNEVAPDRKCFRLIGGVLVERTVKEVSPALTNNRDKMTKLIETLETQLTEKGQEINGYIEKHNIQIRNQPNVGGGGGGRGGGEKENEEDSKSSGVLVSSKS